MKKEVEHMHFNELRTRHRTLWLILVALFLLMPFAAHAVAPADPSDLLATAQTSSQVLFTWTESSSDVYEFVINISANDWSYWNYYTLPGDARSLKIDNLAPGTVYTISIYAYNAIYEYSSQVSTTVETPPAPTPVITAIRSISTTSLVIDWTDARPDTAWYEIEIIGGPYPTGRYPLAGTASYEITDLSPNTLYAFRIRSYDVGYHASNFSDPVQAATKSDVAAPELTAAALSSKRVKLIWTDPTTNETAYYVEFQKGGNGSFTILQQLPANTVTYTHTNLEPGVNYSYRVRSFNGNNYGPYSEPKTVTTPECVQEGAYIK